MTAVRLLIGYLLAVALTTVAGSALQTHQVVRDLQHAGADIAPALATQMTLSDLTTFGPQFGAIVAIALAVGFIVAAILKRVLKPLAPVAYVIAGGTAIAAAMLVLPILLKLDGIVPLAGARGTGLALQALAGAFGGLVFSLIAVRK